jgi:hypothetical protein
VRERTRTPLPDARTLTLATEGIPNWYSIHVQESDGECLCTETGGPDPACDTGEALHRLSASAQAGKLDAHRGRA